MREYHRLRSFAVVAPVAAALALLPALFLGACGGVSPNAMPKSATPSAVAVTPSPTLVLGLWQPGTDSQTQTAAVA